ncbi:hypothetical protein BVX94_03915 [bacterium B17]|nr:hypothetical protein BVX94_03915 [bacterium B17]
MEYFKKDSVFVFLDANMDTLKSRVKDFSTRGLAKRPDQSFEELFEERLLLYNKYADITVSCDGLTQEEVCERIIRKTS